MKLGPIERPCQRCNSLMHIWPYEAPTRKFCSPQCRRNRVQKTCPYCRGIYEIIGSQAEGSKTCRKRECVRQHRREKMIGNTFAKGAVPNAGTFKSGLTPWNKGVRGLRFSPQTEFKKGMSPATKVPIGTVRIRTFTRNGEQRAFIKIAEPNVWKLRAIVEWEKWHGKVPQGKIVHHKDTNSLNDSRENLVALSRSEHLKIHKQDFEKKRKEALSMSPKRKRVAAHPE